MKKKQRHSWVGKGFLARFFNFLMGGRKTLPLSRLNFCGISPKLMTHMMKKQNVATLPELITAAKELGVRMVPCEMSMQILGIKKEDLVDEAEEVAGVPTFLDDSENAKIIFI